MKSCDSLNQRTGQPRCAQLMAKTVKSLAPEVAPLRRTYAGTCAVAPSHAFVNGLVKDTRLVWPAAKSYALPSAIHCRYSLRLLTGPRIYATTGVAMASATTAQ